MLNPWLEEKLRKVKLGPEILSLILEVEPEAREDVKREASEISGVSIERQAFNFIEVRAPVEAVAALERIPGVRVVHYSMPKRIVQLPPLGKLTSIFDPLIGEVRIDDVICPRNRLLPDLVLPFSPIRAMSAPLPFLRIKPLVRGPLGEVNLIPTSESRRVVRDVESPLSGKGVKVAILDTGGVAFHPQTLGMECISACSSDPTPLDYHGHGSWTSSASTGARAVGMFGRMEGVAPGASRLHIKVLNGMFGFGNSFDIIKGMELAWARGAKVVSMSLGGEECQGGCENCPECKVVDALSREGIIFCIAAGNSGPDAWTIGCPGCAPSGITVASVSITDYPRVAHWNSRGPSNKANKDKAYEPKPDIAAPGGGRAEEGAEPDEVLYSGEEGWMKGIYHGNKLDIGACMHGTSQATPHLAGLCALLVEAGYNTAEEIKSVFAAKGHEKNIEEGWGVAKLSWFL